MLESLKRTARRATLHHLAAAVVLGLVVANWRTVYFAYREPPLWIVVIVLACAVALARRIPTMPWIWWGLGAITLAWSLAPGNTLVGSLWELGYVAAFGAGAWLGGFWAASVLLLLIGLQDTLSLSAFGLTQFMSGSIHYVAGATALPLIALAYAGVVRSNRLSVRLGYGAILLAASFLASSSGSRAVYLPLALVIVVMVVRLLVERVRPVLVLGVLVVLAGSIYGIDAALPWRPVTQAIGQRATVESQVRSASQGGSFDIRLRYWNQTLDIALANPLGSGTGSFQAIIHAYQKYPMVWSASPHNYFLETLATGGWLRFAALLALLVAPLWRAWRKPTWPWAVASVGIWATLAFDVTSYYPIFMMYAFATLGATHFASAGVTAVRAPARSGVGVTLRARPRVWLAATVLLAGGAMAAWWFVPCRGATCATSRYLGADFEALPALADATPEVRSEMLRTLRSLYPESLWVLRAEQAYAQTPSEDLAIAKEIATRFPYQSPDNYLVWANAALATGELDEARDAIAAGLVIFPGEPSHYGGPRMSRDAYQAWVDEATAILEGEGP